MKQYIKTFAFMLLVGFGLTSCLDDDRFDKETINYPDGVNFGAWASDYTEGNYEYHAVLTKSAAGDSIFYLHRIGKPDTKEAGVVSRMFIAEGVNYDKVAGLCSATAAESAYGDMPATISAAYQRDQQHLSVQIDANKRYVATMAPTTKMYVDGYWLGGIKDETGADIAFFNAFLEPGEVENEGTGIAIFDSELNDPETVSYKYADGVLTVQSDDNEANVITASFNDICQLVVTDAKGNSFVADPQMSDVPVPEYTFDKPLIGDFNYSAHMSGPDPDLILRPVDLSDPNAAVFNIEHWGYDVTFRFIWDMENNRITVPVQNIGETYDYQGNTYDIMVADIPTWNPNNSFDNFPSYYDAATATFHFSLVYFIELGYFGYDDETFEITGEAPEDATRLKLLTHNAKKKAEGQTNLVKAPNDQVIPFTLF